MDAAYDYLATKPSPLIYGTPIEVLGFVGLDHGDVVGSAEATHRLKGARWLKAICVGSVEKGVLYKPVVGGQLGVGTSYIAQENVRVRK